LCVAVVDGEDLTRFDNTEEELEQSRNDADTLAQLDRELTEQSLGWLSTQ
jgi:hypothetical protein